MKKRLIEEDLLKILLSELTTDDIRLLLKSDHLNKDEEKICEEMYHNFIFSGSYQIEKILKQNEYDLDYINSIEKINKNKIDEEIENLIISRRKKQNEDLYKLALDDSAYNTFNENTINVINKRYKSIVQINEDNIIEDLEYYYADADNDKGLSFQLDKLDEITNGIPIGITTIISNEKEYRHVYAINLTYNMIINGKNVLYISLNYNKKMTLLDLISRHSCNNEKFNKGISREEIVRFQDENTYRTVYLDFKDTLASNLVLYDTDSCNVQNIFALQRMITCATNQFEKNNNSKIDLVIVDGIEQLHIDTNRKVITNKNAVESEYYKFYKDIKYPVVITNEPKKESIDIINSGGHFNMAFLSDSTKYYSNIIISIRGNSSSDKAKKMKLSLLKNPNDQLIDELLITADKNYAYIKYETDGSNDEISKEIKYGRLEKECNEIKEENKKLEESVQSLSFQIMDMMNPKETEPIDLPPLDANF